VDEGIDQSSYQLARDESCMECFDKVSGGDSGRESAYQMRQCHSSGIYKQARGNQINTTLSSFMGHDAVVFKTQDSHPCSSYSREKAQRVHRMSMLGDLDKDCKTLEAESWHEWQRDLCLGFPLFEKYVELLMV
jgi:hypothetical protein